MRAANTIEELDIYVWEGKADIVERVMRCMASFDVDVIRADGMTMTPPSGEVRSSLAIVSVSVIDGAARVLHDWQATNGMPVIWVGAVPRERDPAMFPHEYAHVLPLDFTCAELRGGGRQACRAVARAYRANVRADGARSAERERVTPAGYRSTPGYQPQSLMGKDAQIPNLRGRARSARN